MAEFSVSMWFSVEANSWKEAYAAVSKIGNAVLDSEDVDCTDFGKIDVETEEELEDDEEDE